MNQQKFEKLCQQIADVPWKFSRNNTNGSINAFFNEAEIRLFPGRNIAFFKGNTSIFIDLIEYQQINIYPSNELLRKDFAVAQLLLNELELKYIASEIAPNAKWVFGENHAQTDGLIIIRRSPEPWSMGVGSRWHSVYTTSGLIASYREHRAKHDAARGIKTRLPTVATAISTQEWEPPSIITVEHARNILACLANPTKYTRIAKWARTYPRYVETVLHRALAGV